MKWIISIILLLPICSACSEDEQAKTGLLVINNILSSFDGLGTESFKVSGTVPSRIITQDSIVIAVRPDQLIRSDGAAIDKSDSLTVEFKFVASNFEMLLLGLETESEGKPLESAGCFQLRIHQGGEELLLKEGGRLSMNLYDMALKDGGYEVFYRELNGDKGTWIPSNDKLSSSIMERVDTIKVTRMYERLRSDIRYYLGPITKEELEYSRVAFEQSSLDISRLGWVNIDRFMEDGNLFDLKLELEDSGLKELYAKVLIPELNFYIEQYLRTEDQGLMLSNLIKGRDIIIFLFGYQGGQIYFSHKKLERKKKRVKMVMEPVDIKNLQQTIASYKK